MKKVLSLLFVIALALTAAGCSKDDDVEVLKHLGPYRPFDPNEDPNAAEIERLTGQKVEYYMLPQTNTDEKLYLDIAGGADYNSILIVPHQFQKLYSSGALLDLTDLIEEHGPNIKSAISQTSWDTATFDGKIYAIPQKNASDNINKALFVRMDILKEHGVTKLPETLEDFETTLKKLKDGGVEVPFCAPNFSIETIRGAFGIVLDWVEQKDGTLKFWVETDEFKDYADYVAKLEDDELIQSGYITEATNCTQLFTTGQTAFIESAWWAADNIYQSIASSKDISVQNLLDNVDDYIQYIPSLAGKDGTVQARLDRSITYFVAIPRYMEDEAVATIKWLDKKLEPKIHKEIAIGKEGETFEVIDGKYYPILEPKNDDGSAPFDVKNTADWYLTGLREDVYGEYWQARARKIATQQHSWESINANPDKYGIYNPIGLAPAFSVWSQHQATIAQTVNDFLTLYLTNDSRRETIDKLVQDLNTKGLKESSKEINDWYKDNK